MLIPSNLGRGPPAVATRLANVERNHDTGSLTLQCRFSGDRPPRLRMPDQPEDHVKAGGRHEALVLRIGDLPYLSRGSSVNVARCCTANRRAYLAEDLRRQLCFLGKEPQRDVSGDNADAFRICRGKDLCVQASFFGRKAEFCSQKRVNC